jgi:hypothetical protein
MKKLKFGIAATSALVLALSLSSCAPETKEADMDVSQEDSRTYCELNVQKSPVSIPAQTVAILAPTDNFVDFLTLVTRSETEVINSLGGNLPDPQLEESIGREFSVVLADGRPRMLAKRSVQPLGESAYDIRDAVNGTFGIFRQANKCAAGGLKRPDDQVETKEGSNILKALSIAADQLTIDGPKKIFILSNGIQTEGAIEMQEKGMFPKSEASAKLLAQGLNAIGEIPDLQGAEVLWYGLGQVDGVNQELSEKSAKSLESFWRQVIKYANGQLKEVCAQCGAGDPHRLAIPVPTFEVKTCTLIKLYEEDGVEFLPNSATFKNLSKAKATAKNMSTQFQSKGCDEMTVTGFAAAGVDKVDYQKGKTKIDSTNKKLTKKRAAAFASLVRAAGYKGSISSAGAGTCGTEWTGAGKVDNDLQRMCRRVEVSN